MRTGLEEEGSDTGAVTPSPRPVGTPDTALDFDCNKIVLALAPRGGETAGKELVQFLNYRRRKQRS